MVTMTFCTHFACIVHVMVHAMSPAKCDTLLSIASWPLAKMSYDTNMDVSPMLQENPNQNIPIIRNMTAGDTIHIPQGVVHFSHNPYCQPAAFLANFGERDPGTQTIWNSLMRVPSYILNAATGLTEDTINQLKSLPLVTAPGTGGEECLRRCGLNFTAVSLLAFLFALNQSRTNLHERHVDTVT